METSIFLAKVIGIIGTVSAISVMIRYKKMMALEKELVASPGPVVLSGYVILILGTLMVVSHSIWTSDWRVVITIVGWAALLKGLGRIFWPEAVKNMIEKKQHNHKFIIGEIIVLVVGLYLLYYGFIVF